jgi:PAS domain S-box-containing protein
MVSFPQQALSAPGYENWYRELFESACLGIYASRVDGTLIWCNAAFAEMLRFESVDDAMSTNLVTIYPSPDQRTALLEQMQRHRRLDHVRLRFRRRDGRLIQVIATIVGAFDASDKLTELRGFILDVTESAAAEEALREREQQFHSVFSGAADAMLILDDHRRVVDVNGAAATLVGRPAEELVDHPLDGLLLDDGERLATAWRELQALGEARADHRVMSAGRGPRLVECSYRAGVRTGRHLCIARDITDRRLIEDRLVQSEKIESVGRLAGGIAHDFNNLLTAILGYTELLLSKRTNEDPDRADLEEIQRAGQRAAALTQQLLAYSRKQVLVPKEVDINQTVLSLLQGMLARLIREDISMTYELSQSPALVRIDPAQLERVIVNLVLNSRDAMPGGGSIRLEVSRVKLGQAQVPADTTPAPEYVRLRVIDNGSGMSPEVRSHLFEPFFTTKEIGKGTGLGLASVYGIVRQSNGFIGVESEPGMGTTFTMHFPAVSGMAQPEEPAAATPAPAGGWETILLVEDEDSVRAIVSAVLRRQGYRVLEAATGQGACDIFEQRATEIDLLVTDVVMPGMNGPSLAQRLVGLRPQLRVLFISGYSDATVDVERPNISFLSKPFQASTLATKVREVLSRPRIGP